MHPLLWSRTNLANLDIPSETVPTLTSQSALIIASQCFFFFSLNETPYLIQLSGGDYERGKFVKLFQWEVVHFSSCHSARLKVSSNARTWSEAANLDVRKDFFFSLLALIRNSALTAAQRKQTGLKRPSDIKSERELANSRLPLLL